MGETIRRIRVSPESKLARALQAALDTLRPVEIDTGTAVYELFVGSAAGAAPGAATIAQSIAGIRDAAGSWKDVDIDAFNAYREERRRLHTRPPVEL